MLWIKTRNRRQDPHKKSRLYLKRRSLLSFAVAWIQSTLTANYLPIMAHHPHPTKNRRSLCMPDCTFILFANYIVLLSYYLLTI